MCFFALIVLPGLLIAQAELNFEDDDTATKNVVSINNLEIAEVGLFDVQFDFGSISEVFGADFGEPGFVEPFFWEEPEGAVAASVEIRDLFNAQTTRPELVSGDTFFAVLYGQFDIAIEAYEVVFNLRPNADWVLVLDNESFPTRQITHARFTLVPEPSFVTMLWIGLALLILRARFWSRV